MSRQRQAREKNLRADIIEGSVWVPFLSTDRMSPRLTVRTTPGPADAEVLVESHGGKTYLTRITSLLGQYHTRRDEPIVPHASRPSSTVDPLPKALRKLTPSAVVPEAVATPAEIPIPTNGDGAEVIVHGHRVPLYPFRGQMVAVVGHLDAPLEYAVRGVAQLVAGEWAAELRADVDFFVVRGEELRQFKAASEARGATPLASKVAQLTVLTEAGLDRVCLLTKKPAGVALRAALADKVFPRLRRGEPVAPAASAPAVAPALNEERLVALVAAGVAAAMRPILTELRQPAPASPAAPVVAPAPTRLIPRSWLSAQMIAALLSERRSARITENKVNTAIRALGIREREDVAAHRMVQQQSSGVAYDVPAWRYEPSVLDEIDRHLFPPAASQQQTLPVAP